MSEEINQKSIILNGVLIQMTYEAALESAKGGSMSLTRNYILRKKGDNALNRTQEMDQEEAYACLQSYIIRYQQTLIYHTNEWDIKLWAGKIRVEVDKDNYPVYKGTVTWELDLRKPDYLVQPITWSHRMVGGTRTTKFPVLPQRYFPRPGMPQINFAGVNWNGKEAEYEGVECYAPEWQTIAKQQILKNTVADDYIRWLVYMSKTVNALPFNNLPPGTVLYLGADIDEGKYRENDVYNLTHQFIVEPNLENFYVDGIFVPFKGGHEYLWTTVAKQIVGGVEQYVVTQVNIAQMYHESDLNLLFT